MQTHKEEKRDTRMYAGEFRDSMPYFFFIWSVQSLYIMQTGGGCNLHVPDSAHLSVCNRACLCSYPYNAHVYAPLFHIYSCIHLQEHAAVYMCSVAHCCSVCLTQHILCSLSFAPSPPLPFSSFPSLHSTPPLSLALPGWHVHACL